MAKTRDTVLNTFLTTAVLCIVCSVFVSASAVGLKSRQELNKQLDKKKNILSVCQIDFSNGDVQSIYDENIQAYLVDLQTGFYAEQTHLIQNKLRLNLIYQNLQTVNLRHSQKILLGWEAGVKILK